MSFEHYQKIPSAEAAARSLNPVMVKQDGLARLTGHFSTSNILHAHAGCGRDETNG
ncbi:MAG: hypothetical protein WBQ86_05625 [Candidatus Binatus sp.]